MGADNSPLGFPFPTKLTQPTNTGGGLFPPSGGGGLGSGLGTLAMGAATGNPVGMIMGGLQTAAGIGQYLRGRRLAKNTVRPTYEIPGEIKNMLSEAQNRALQGLPEAQRQRFVQGISRSQNLGLQGLNDRKAGISGLGGIVEAGNQANVNLLSMDAAARERNQANLQNVQGTYAGFQDKAFDINKFQPYQEKAQAAEAMKGSGLQNIWGGLGSIAGQQEQKSVYEQVSGGDISGIGSVDDDYTRYLMLKKAGRI